MKLSLNWLKEYVELPENLSIEELSYQLTMKTVEVEGWEDLKKKYENIVVGKIKSVDEHPDAHSLKVCSVDIGESEAVQIVCGGTNLRIGQSVVVAKPDSYVLWHGEGEPVKMKVSKVRGVESFGMICGANEVGLMDLYPPKEDHEIVDLKDLECKPGESISEVLHMNDSILDIDNKSLTNRPDLYCHYGIARELSVIFETPLKELPYFKIPDNLPEVPIIISAEDACRRCVGAIIENVKPKESPMWLKSALSKAGMRPKNNIIDITNYVNLAVGQPSHAYDKNKIKGSFIIRNAKKGEELTLLDDTTLKLSADNLLIADEEEPKGLAGIMGGKNDSISKNTDSIILEMANFKDTAIRKTVKEFDLRTESSIRYEKNIDTARIDGAFALTMKLFSDLIPESKLSAFTDLYLHDTKNKNLKISVDFLRKRTGRDIDPDDVVKVLNKLGFFSVIKGDVISTTAPTWRSTGDISIQDDILEEVSRMIGYDQFETTRPELVLNNAINQKEHNLERQIKEYLAFRCDFREIYTYPWVEDIYINAAGIIDNNPIKLANPPAPNMARIRSSLIPGLLKSAEKNTRYFSDFNIFELTQVFKNTDKKSGTEENLPEQSRYLGASCVGKDPEDIFYKLKGVVEGFNKYLSMEKIYLEQREKPSWADKDAWVNIMLRGNIIGSLALVSIRTLALAGIKHAYISMFEINVEELIPLKSRTNKFTHLPVFPLVEQDLSVIVDESVKWGDIEKTIAKNVNKSEFMDEYRGKQIPEGKKSIMFRVYLGSNKGTMKSEEVDNVVKEILEKLKGAVEAEIRS